MPLFELIISMFSQVLYLSGYICKNNTFPPPLSQEEEQIYIDRLKNGDTDARRILIERNLRLVAHIAKKYGDENTLDDFISIGTIGLIKGIDTYDFSKNCKLSPYISRCIENEVLMTLRKDKKRSSDISMDDSLGTDKDGNNLTLSDILPADTTDIADMLWAKIEEQKLYKTMKQTLTPTEIKILWHRYGLGNTKRKTQREIAEELGISRSYISRIEKKCLKKLYDKLNSG